MALADSYRRSRYINIRQQNTQHSVNTLSAIRPNVTMMNSKREAWRYEKRNVRS
jgi:hypothetical protein